MLLACIPCGMRVLGSSSVWRSEGLGGAHSMLLELYVAIFAFVSPVSYAVVGNTGRCAATIVWKSLV